MAKAHKLAAYDPFNKRQVRLYRAGPILKAKTGGPLQRTGGPLQKSLSMYDKRYRDKKSPPQKANKPLSGTEDNENKEGKNRASKVCSDKESEEIIPPSEEDNPLAKYLLLFYEEG